MAAAPVTVLFEGKDNLSRHFQMIGRHSKQTAQDIGMADRSLDRLTDAVGVASKAVADLSQMVGELRSDIGRIASANIGVDREFQRASREARSLRTEVNNADRAISGLDDSVTVDIRADDQASPVVDQIHSRIAALSAAAAGIVIGGSMSDAMFGGSMDYYHEAARLAPYMSESQQVDTIYRANELYTQGFGESRAGVIKQMADNAPLVGKNGNTAEFTEQVLKIQYLRPDSSEEEISRALSQASNVFKETPKQVSDSMMYAYKQVGDRQQDLFDTFWEYSGYFKNTGANSAQMSNFLVESVKAGAFNYDKPADAFKEIFGVQALDQGDMQAYFEHRGAGKDEAKKQSEQFVADINSADKQKANGALAALLADLASQDEGTLKQSLVDLGAGPAEDIGNALFKSYATAFEKPPDDISGTTDTMVKKQKEADPFTEVVQTRREIEQMLSDIGSDAMIAMLPAMKEIGAFLKENKEDIQQFFEALGSGATAAANFYREHTTLVNALLVGVLAIGAALAAWRIGSGVVNGIREMASAAKSVGGGISTAGKKAGGWVKGKFKKEKEDDTPAYRRPVEDHSMYGTPRKQEPEKKQSWFSRMKDAGEDLGNNKPSYFQRAVNIGGKAVKGAGIVGAVAGTAAAGYELYQTAKTSGWRNAVSQRGGAVAGGAIGGVVGGAAGSLLGPVGTAAGAYVGNQIGSKLGGMIDAKGWTASAVKQLDSLKTKAAGTFDSLKSKATGAFSSLKVKTVGWWSGSDAKKAQTDMQAVGSAAKSGGQQVSQASQQAGQSVKQLGTISTQSTNQIKTGAQQAGQSFQTVSSAAGSAASQTKAHLESIGGVVGKGSSWGANLIDMVAGGIRAKLPSLASAASKAASTIKNFLGFSSPTKEGPASNSDRWAPNFINMFADGIDEQIIGRKMSRVAATMNQPIRGQASIDVMPHSKAAPGGDIPVSTQFSKPSGVSVQVGDINVTFDVGDMLGQVQNGAEFLKAISSPQGKKVLKTAINQIIVEACELGG
jgi:phage-related minor tail protein